MWWPGIPGQQQRATYTCIGEHGEPCGAVGGAHQGGGAGDIDGWGDAEALADGAVALEGLAEVLFRGKAVAVPAFAVKR